jgi:hypothetical protein
MRKIILRVRKNFYRVRKIFSRMRKNFYRVRKNILRVRKNSYRVRKNILRMRKNSHRTRKNAWIADSCGKSGGVYFYFLRRHTNICPLERICRIISLTLQPDQKRM